MSDKIKSSLSLIDRTHKNFCWPWDAQGLPSAAVERSTGFTSIRGAQDPGVLKELRSAERRIEKIRKEGK